MNIWIDTDIPLLYNGEIEFGASRTMIQMTVMFIKENKLWLHDKVGFGFSVDGKKYDIQKIYTEIADSVCERDDRHIFVELSKNKYQI